MRRNHRELLCVSLCSLLVVAAGVVAYHNSFTGPFIFDDMDSILGNPTIRSLWPISHVLSPLHRHGLTVGGRPLVNFSLAVNYAIGGTEVWGYHVVNLTVHILAGLTLLGIVRRTLLQPALHERFGSTALPLALATAVIWIVHPLQTESVTYVVQRAESMMGLFYLLTLYFFIRGTDSRLSNIWYSLCVAACALGMTTKEVMVSAPLMVLLYDRTFVSLSFREAWRRRWPLYLALAGTWLLLGYLVISAGSIGSASNNARTIGVVWWAYFLTEPGVILHYLQLSVWPRPLCLDYWWPMATTWTSILPPLLLVVVLFGVCVRAWKKNSVWGYTGAWFFLILSPTSSFLPLDSAAYEHRMYLPLAAVVVLAVIGVHALVGRWSMTVFIVIVAGLVFLTLRRNEDYRSELIIWTDTAAKRPDNPRAHDNLGLALQRAGKIPEAVAQYEEALRISPNFAHAHNNLGAVLYKTGKLQDAIQHYEQALQTTPNDAAVRNNLGLALVQAGRISEALSHYEQALRINPSEVVVHMNFGNALVRNGDMQGAIGHYRQALRMEPDFTEARIELGTTLAELGRLDESVAQLAEAVRIDPRSANAHYNLGVVLARQGKLAEAAEQFQHAVTSDPQFEPARRALEDLRTRGISKQS